MTNKGDPPARREDASGPGQPSDQNLPRRDSWISDLARRSSGLPADETPVSKSSPESPDKGPWKLAGLGLQLALTTAIFAFMGYALDKHMGWSPWSVIVLVLIAVVGNMYLLIKESLKEERPKAKK